MTALAVTAVLLLATSGCAGEPTSPQPSATAPPASSEAEKPMNDALAQRLDAAVNQAMTAAGVPGAIVGIWGPDGNYVRAFGVADKATGAPMKTDFYSRIGSVTKTFTVTGVLQLADQGKLGLDDPIAKFVDGVPAGRQDHAAAAGPDAERAGQLHRFTGVPAGAVRRPAAAFTPQELLDYAFAATDEVSARRRISSTATPTRCCSVWWWRRSADNRCTPTSTTTS